MKLELFAEKSYKKGHYYSFSFVPSLNITYEMYYMKRKTTIDLHWLFWYVGVELIKTVNE